MQFFAIIEGILKAVPIADRWVQQFIVWYTNQAIDRMSADNAAAIKKAIQGKDQRDLEKAIGNPDPGGYSNVPGSVVRDDLPGVPHAPASSGVYMAQQQPPSS